MKRKTGELNASQSPSLSVRPVWLKVSNSERYLLLEDKETGDVLLPLIYMKGMFEANYSRKLSSLKHRLVTLPDSLKMTKPNGFMYWQWAFESPHEVKVLVRKMLGEENTPQGHLRLILLPIVFNAMSQKESLRQSGFFQELLKVVQVSTYWPLLRKSPPEEETDVVADSPSPGGSIQLAGSGSPKPSLWDSNGPEVSQGKKIRCTTTKVPKPEQHWSQKEEAAADPRTVLGLSTSAMPQAKSICWDNWKEWNEGREVATLDLIGDARRSEARETENSSLAEPIFHGPFDYQQTLKKYCVSYENGEAQDIPKGGKHGVGSSSMDGPVNGHFDILRQQGNELQANVKDLRASCQKQMLAVFSELGSLKSSLVTVLAAVVAAGGALSTQPQRPTTLGLMSPPLTDHSWGKFSRKYSPPVQEQFEHPSKQGAEPEQLSRDSQTKSTSWLSQIRKGSSNTTMSAGPTFDNHLCRPSIPGSSQGLRPTLGSQSQQHSMLWPFQSLPGGKDQILSSQPPISSNPELTMATGYDHLFRAQK